VGDFTFYHKSKIYFKVKGSSINNDIAITGIIQNDLSKPAHVVMLDKRNKDRLE
jgi:hypothetical protein